VLIANKSWNSHGYRVVLEDRQILWADRGHPWRRHRIEDREFVVFVGPSGCGNSTLLRMLAGLESVSGGEIRIGRTLFTELAPKDRDVAMVFQNYALYPHMTVADNIAFPLKMTGVQKNERAKKRK
jgi:multiple sugar transport system ATP-binding protein